MKMVDFLLKSIPDYKKVLVNRHHKFVQSYFEYNGNLTMIGHAHGYSSLEIRRIFWRIQRKLLLEFVDRIDKGNVMFSRVPSTFKHFLLWQLSQFRDDAEIVSEYILNKMNKQQQQQQHKPVAKVTKAVKVEKEEVKSRFNIDGVTKARRVKVERILDHLSKVENLENIMPKRAYAIAKDLLDGVSFTEVLEIARQKIYDATKRFSPNWMLIASNILPVLTFIPGFQAAPAGQINGPYFAGTVNGLKVFVTPNITPGKFVVGCLGNDMMSAAAVYAPYLPVVPTALLQYADGLTSQGFSTMYDLRKLNENLVIAGAITD